MSYRKYFKDVSGYDVIDVYRAHRIFGLNDEVLCHASKKLLLSGVRTGGKTLEQDVREARDSLNRWLEMLQEDLGNSQEKDGWTPKAINEAAFDTGIPVSAAFKDAYKEYTLQEVLGGAVLSDWAVAVTVDADGDVFEHGGAPYIHDELAEWVNPKWRFNRINKVVRPLNFKNCIWEVNK